MKHLPDAMELDDKEEDNFEKAGDQEPEKMPDFEDDVKDKEEERDEEGVRRIQRSSLQIRRRPRMRS